MAWVTTVSNVPIQYGDVLKQMKEEQDK